METMKCEHDWVDGACGATAPLGTPGWELRTGRRGDQFWMCPKSAAESPSPVTEAMVRAASRAFWDGNPQFMADHADDMRAALEAALAVRNAEHRTDDELIRDGEYTWEEIYGTRPTDTTGNEAQK